MSRLTLPLILQRRFQLWSYGVSHSVLLLRSNTSSDATSRIDLMFRSVTALKIRHCYDWLRIGVALPQDIGDDQLQLGDVSDRFLFTVGASADDLGYVVAGSLFLSEDDLEDGQPSTIGNRELAAPVIRSGVYR